MIVPAEFATQSEARTGSAGRAWVDTLPQTVDDLCRRWCLVVEDHPRFGGMSLAIPVRRDAEPCVLKLGWIDADTMHEAHALQLWNGRDMVRLLESSPEQGAMLLERLDAQRTLFDLPLDQAIPIAGEMVRNLAVPGDDTLPTVAELAATAATIMPKRWADRGHSVPRRVTDEAVDLATSLPTSTVTTMVNWDLHYGNVLFSPARQQWVGIDPKPATGVPEYGIAQIFMTRIADLTSAADFHWHLDVLIGSAGLDADLSRAWMRVRVVDFWLWELSVGLTDDPGGCATIMEWLDQR